MQLSCFLNNVWGWSWLKLLAFWLNSSVSTSASIKSWRLTVSAVAISSSEYGCPPNISLNQRLSSSLLQQETHPQTPVLLLNVSSKVAALLTRMGKRISWAISWRQHPTPSSWFTLDAAAHTSLARVLCIPYREACLIYCAPWRYTSICHRSRSISSALAAPYSPVYAIPA